MVGRASISCFLNVLYLFCFFFKLVKLFVDWFIFSWWLVFSFRFLAHVCMHPSINSGGHWVLFVVHACACWYCIPMTGAWWVDLCVNQWSGIDHGHPRVPMSMGTTCAWGLKGIALNSSGLPIDTYGSSNSENVRVKYLKWLMCLSLEFNFHLI